MKLENDALLILSLNDYNSFLNFFNEETSFIHSFFIKFLYRKELGLWWYEANGKMRHFF